MMSALPAIHGEGRLIAGGVTSASEVSRNLHGQKLGRKGRITRDRILNACRELLADTSGAPLSLSEVARRASLGMTSLYNYFADLTELLLAVLEPIAATVEDSLAHALREHWPDEELGERSYLFMTVYHEFWSRHSRLFHLCNAMADEHDQRMLEQRLRVTEPLIDLMTAQLNGDTSDPAAPERGIATVLLIGLERTVTVANDPDLAGAPGDPNYYLQPAARMLELSIRDADWHRATVSAASRDGQPFRALL